MYPRFVLLLALVFAAAIGGCDQSFIVGPLSPQPNVALPSKRPAMELLLAPTVRDTFVVPEQNGIMGGTVGSWHHSLTTGFQNAFPPGGSPDDKLTLQLDLAEFSVVQAAVRGNGAVVAGRGQLRYRGRWVRGDQEVLISGTAESKQTTSSGEEIPKLANSAIESMYEQAWSALVAGAK